MNIQMQKALLLAEQMHSFIDFFHKCNANHIPYGLDATKLYQIKSYIEEYRFSILADELHRINQFSYDDKYTNYLVHEFRKGLNVIEGYYQLYEKELYMLGGRLHTLNGLCSLFEIRE